MEKFDADVYVNGGDIEVAVEVAMADIPREIEHIESHLEKGIVVWVVCRDREVLQGLQQRLQEKEVDVESLVYRLFRELSEV